MFDNSAAVRVDAGASLDEGLSLSETDEGQVRVEGSTDLEDGLLMNANASAHITAMCQAIGAFDGLDVQEGASAAAIPCVSSFCGACTL